MRYLPALLTTVILGAAIPAAAHPAGSVLTLTDSQRGRQVPVELHLPTDARSCTTTQPCPVAVLSHGYGLRGADYSFITRQLAALGYLVVTVEHALPGDPGLDSNGDMVAQRAAMARAGARNLRVVFDQLAPMQPRFDWRHVLLVGHSMGGDSSALFAVENGAPVAALVSLDNRRSVLPRSDKIKVLSIRASDTTADPGVLPTQAEQARYGTCVVTIAGSRHNDMQDAGSAMLKDRIAHALSTFLEPAGHPRYACDSDSRLD
jgi:pimeloyl-ACP methyl ester carboxylesterase